MRRHKRTNKPLCVSCAITASVRANIEIHRHAGPAYDRWLTSPGAKGRPRGSGK